MNTRLLSIALLGAATSFTLADTFHSITDIATPNMVEGNPGGNPLTNVIQGAGAGFDINPPHNATGGTWYTNAPGGGAANYIEVNPGDEIIYLDLGADVALGEISVWGYAATNGNGLKDFSVRFATDAEGGAPGLGDEMYGTAITLNPSYTAALNPNPRQSFGFGEAVTARYVEVFVTTNYFLELAGGDRLGAGEIAFAELTATGGPDIEVASEVALNLETFAADYDIPVRNTGDADLEILTTPTFSGPNAAAFGVTMTPAPIGTFLTDNIVVNFDPTGLGGAISATMSFTHNDLDETPTEILITGSLPALGPEIQVTSPTVVLLGDIVENFDVEVFNNGGMDLVITGTNWIGDDAGAFTMTVAPGPIPSLSFDFITFQYDPAGLESGPVDATLQIMSNDSVTPTAEIVISGGVATTFYPITTVSTNTVNFFVAPNLIQGIGVGFDSLWPHNAIGAGAGATWVTDAPNGGASYYDNAQPFPVIIFDLGEDQALGEISTWGYANGNTNGGMDYSLRFATAAEGSGGFGSSITYNPAFAAAFSADTRDSHLFSEIVTAQYVEMTVSTNWRGLVPPLAGGDRVGFGEVAFEVQPTPPDNSFQITDVEILPGGNVQLTFESVQDIVYELERSITGEDGSWTKLPDTAVGGAGETSTIVDTDPLSNEPVVLYRVLNTGLIAK